MSKNSKGFVSIPLNILPWSDTSYEYFEINGDEPNPEMKYDHEMKVRAEFWSNIHDQIYTRFKYLSGSQPKTMAELPIFSKRPKEDL